jgi:two-component system, OmpR family, manganese sensing sensor histidine kinase
MQHYPERIHPQDVKKLRAIATSANRMAHLVDDLLLLARINELTAEGEQGFKWVSLDQILEELLDLLELQAQEQGVALKSDLLKGVRVKGDATQLRRLFANLLDNALQYTLPGGIVTLAMWRNYHTALVFVKDTGIGIEPDQLGFVFDRFWRADKARSRRAGSSGLGLAIAQVIVQRHGGEITVTSQVGVGSCFEVHLPLA